MKRYLKRPLKMLWRWAAPVRRPIMAKIEATLVRCCNQPTTGHTSDETLLLMDHLVRELVRLQKQVDHLQQTLEDMAATPGTLSVVGNAEREAG